MNRQAERQLLDERKCFVCFRVLPEGAGIFHTALHGLLCQDTCWPVANALHVVHDRSKRGRMRPLAEWKRLVRDLRKREGA